jgi:hypothetical protein
MDRGGCGGGGDLGIVSTVHRKNIEKCVTGFVKLDHI